MIDVCRAVGSSGAVAHDLRSDFESTELYDSFFGIWNSFLNILRDFSWNCVTDIINMLTL